MFVKPLRNLVYIERVVQEMTAGGIHIPQTFDDKDRPSLKYGAKRDYFEAKVLAVGPDVRELKAGHHVYVHTWAEGNGERLFTGEGTGEKNRMLVSYPDDIVCAVDIEEVAAE